MSYLTNVDVCKQIDTTGYFLNCKNLERNNIFPGWRLVSREAAKRTYQYNPAHNSFGVKEATAIDLDRFDFVYYTGITGGRAVPGILD